MNTSIAYTAEYPLGDVRLYMSISTKRSYDANTLTEDHM
jgi:hypothetical protein